jgi:hypothetical protein
MPCSPPLQYFQDLREEERERIQGWMAAVRTMLAREKALEDLEAQELSQTAGKMPCSPPLQYFQDIEKFLADLSFALY